jgi:hypothetical protein
MLLLSQNERKTESWRLYDPEPNHVWNRLYRCFYRREGRDGREYGYDELDPLLWWSTKYLLKEPAYHQATTILDEFLSARAEKMIADPLKRAILQRDLWAIFDWSTTVLNNSQEKLDLQIKLVQVIKRLALSPDQIAALPNTYKQATDSRAFASAHDPNKREQPFLPPDLFDHKGPWVQLSARGGEPGALAHVGFLSGRSVFFIFMRLPEGRAATVKYLKRLSDFPKPWLPDPEEPRRLLPNPDLPEFPSGTQLALVREMVLIDSQANLRPTNIIEDIQIRVHHTIPSGIPAAFDIDRNKARDAMDVYEFKLSRAELFATQSGGLRALAKGDTEFPLFMSHGIDLFEQPWPGLRVSLQACASCHFRPGVHSAQPPLKFRILMSWDPQRRRRSRQPAGKGRQLSEYCTTKLWNSAA